MGFFNIPNTSMFSDTYMQSYFLSPESCLSVCEVLYLLTLEPVYCIPFCLILHWPVAITGKLMLLSVLADD